MKLDSNPPWPIVRLIVFWYLLLNAHSAGAGEHPVPLEKNTDSAACLECHDEKAKGKAVHSAIAKGCTTCHEVRVNKDITRIKLVKPTAVGLCLSCHENKNAAELKGHVHPPAVRDCLTCHDPHTTENKFVLRKPALGKSKEENLCLSCHAIGVTHNEKGSRHDALDTGCDTCHTTHKTGDLDKQEFKYHLASSVPGLCLDCHEASEPSLQKAHRNQPFEKSDCTTCHDPHESKRPKLIRAYAHSPFTENKCDTCHDAPKDGKIVLVKKNVRELCLTCHAEQGKAIDNAKEQHIGAQGDCTDCHSAHAGKDPAHLKPDPVTACTSCHTEIGDLHSKPVLHQPAFEQGCPTCHEAHGSERANLLRAQGNSLCLECHSSDSRPSKTDDPDKIAIFNGKVRLPHDYFGKNETPRLTLKYGLGHPVINHPVVDVRDPMDQSKIKQSISCLTCHQPHAGGARAMLVKDQRPGMQFCRTCHTGMIEGAQ